MTLKSLEVRKKTLRKNWKLKLKKIIDFLFFFFIFFIHRFHEGGQLFGEAIIFCFQVYQKSISSGFLQFWLNFKKTNFVVFGQKWILSKKNWNIKTTNSFIKNPLRYVFYNFGKILRKTFVLFWSKNYLSKGNLQKILKFWIFLIQKGGYKRV